MIQPIISNRASIEEILNNKWVNKNIELMQKIKNINDNEEIKLFVEFQKYKKIKVKRKKFILKYKKKKMIFFTEYGVFICINRCV